MHAPPCACPGKRDLTKTHIFRIIKANLIRSTMKGRVGGRRAHREPGALETGGRRQLNMDLESLYRCAWRTGYNGIAHYSDRVWHVPDEALIARSVRTLRW